MFKKIFRKLFPEKTITDFPQSYIPSKFVTNNVEKEPILVIGGYKGRDYLPLRSKFNEVYLLDIVDNNIVRDKEYFIHQSVTDSLPKPDNFFKTIVMGEVLEHIWEAKQALEELWRVLDDDGKLIITVPFYSDTESHYHIYSPITLRKILRHSGYEVENLEYRGIAISVPNFIVAALAICLYPIFQEKALEWVNERIYSLHKLLSKSERINKLTKNRTWFLQDFGAYVVARKNKDKVDSIEFQKQSYTDHQD